MEFRWVAGLTVWTMLSGPILSQPSPPRPALSAAPRPILAGPQPLPVMPAQAAMPSRR